MEDGDDAPISGEEVEIAAEEVRIAVPVELSSLLLLSPSSGTLVEVTPLLVGDELTRRALELGACTAARDEEDESAGAE